MKTVVTSIGAAHRLPPYAEKGEGGGDLHPALRTTFPRMREEGEDGGGLHPALRIAFPRMREKGEGSGDLHSALCIPFPRMRRRAKAAVTSIGAAHHLPPYAGGG
ncbi:hypothetical protein [Xanthomonas campestris]|uniref:hypothetical protein n=1 Tax=Xanthomonas campestris TaxID=339 RepID=UPI001E2DB3D0|nr:hypothetical protein [Xanthomonas campestris]MCC4602883.1 hypothetical protein [Xanthomonas campestris pv. parthenii]